MSTFKKIEKVRLHLLEHGSITAWDSIKLYNYTRLSDAIYKLKKRGMQIETIMHYKNGESFAEYKLIKEEEK